MGDSYAYGEDVNDDETWPAYLQHLTGRRVLNGGVSGYGFDQTVLRAEQLVAKHTPATVIVSFIEGDLKRTEMAALWWRDKPWFAIEADRLAYRAAREPEQAKLPRRVHSLLGRCFDRLSPQSRARAQYAENLFAEALPPLLQHRLGYCVRAHPAGVGLDIARRLIERLAELQRSSASEVIVMAQYTLTAWTGRSEAKAERRATQAILDAASASGLATLDTYHRLATEPAPHRFYGKSHMNARGNSMIANLLATTLNRPSSSP